jgi:hypothetical protein
MKTQGFDPAAGRAYAAAKKAGAQQQEDGVGGPLGIVGGRRPLSVIIELARKKACTRLSVGLYMPAPDLPGGDEDNHRGG